MSAKVKMIVGAALMVVFFLPTSDMLGVFTSGDWRIISYWIIAELSIWGLGRLLIIQGMRDR